MRVVMYGGSFNPPHRGHERAARAAMEQLVPARFFLVPGREPPHKALPAGGPSPERRLALTQELAAELPGTEVLDLELRREGASYTVDSLAELKERFPAAEIVFLVGTDMFLSLETWREPARILQLASVGVFQRAPGERPALERQAEHYRQVYGATVYIIESDPLEISSSELRALLPARQGRDYLPEGVYEGIIRRRLYGAKPDLSWLQEKAIGYLDPKRVPHVLGTEEEARRLAQRWGEDADTAAEAALLHDMTKRLGREEQLRLCRKYGIMADTSHWANAKLYHAITGAALAKADFGVPPEIESAIRWHTTGRPGMSRLEKIIYLADYIEPTRHGFEGLEELRALAYEDLDRAMLYGLELSLADIRSRGVEPHEDSRRAAEWFVQQINKQESNETVVDIL